MSDPKSSAKNSSRPAQTGTATHAPEGNGAASGTAASLAPNPPAVAAQAEPKARRITNPVLVAADRMTAMMDALTIAQATRVLSWVTENHAERVTAEQVKANSGAPPKDATAAE